MRILVHTNDQRDRIKIVRVRADFAHSAEPDKISLNTGAGQETGWPPQNRRGAAGVLLPGVLQCRKLAGETPRPSRRRERNAAVHTAAPVTRGLDPWAFQRKYSKKLRCFGVLENTAALDTCGINKRKKPKVLVTKKWAGSRGQTGKRRIRAPWTRRGRDKRRSNRWKAASRLAS
jgi:hypothetical protein